jgi:hypothetical protein
MERLGAGPQEVRGRGGCQSPDPSDDRAEAVVSDNEWRDILHITQDSTHRFSR